MSLIIIQKLILDAILDILYFPLWWYTSGIKFAFKKCFAFFLAGNSRLAPGLWLKNIFVPMFGQWDFQGRIISFFMRLFQVIIRFFILLLWFAFIFVLFCFWLLVPIFVVIKLFNL